MGPHWKGTLPLQTFPVHTWFCTTLASKGGRSAKCRTSSVPLSQMVPFWCVLCLQEDSSLPLHALEAALNLWSVHHPLIGEFGFGFGALAVAVFPHTLHYWQNFCLLYLYGWGSGRGKESKRKWLAYFLLFWGVGSQGGWDRVLQLHLCQGDFSPPSVLSFAEVELQLEAGTGFLRKEEKLGNVYWLVRKPGGFSKSLSGCLFLQK